MSNATTKLKLQAINNNLPETSVNNNEYFTLTESYEISQTRAQGKLYNVTVNKDELVELVFTDNTSWFGDQETLKEIFPELNNQGRSIDDAPLLNINVQSDDTDRSLISKIALKIFRKYAKKIVKPAVKPIAENIEKKGLDKSPGLYRLNDQFQLTAFTTTAANKKNDNRYLLFIHGTLSSTNGAFNKLLNSDVWLQIQKKYGQNILCLEHRTITVSPLQNLLDLITQLPDECTIDIVSHSRGGLVGELLVRFAENKKGFLGQSLELLHTEGHTEDIKNIAAIEKTIGKKKITINRFVRVAAPARGTTILSERTDVFINTLINLIQVANPVLFPLVEGLKTLISATVDCKNDFSELPGLEAMRPDSVFTKILNTYSTYENEKPEAFQNMLAVISGSGRASLTLNGLKVVLTKFFFKWKQNDLVVDTASMYQGAKRVKPVQYYLDDGNNTNHFNYFLNKATRDALAQALFTDGSTIPSFKEVIGENYDAAANRGIFGLENGRLSPQEPKGQKPIVILLPGIMGSFLEQGNKSIWINYMRFALGNLTKLTVADNDNIQATGVIKTAYKDLTEFLSQYYDVAVFPFDWRLSLTTAGDLLNKKINELLKLKKTVYLIGHSMGGLVIRDLIINHAETWKTLNEQTNFKTILLGTPWTGSYRIPHVLSGRDEIIKQLSIIDFANSKRTLINMFSKFPGLLDLLPIHGNIDFSNTKIWEEFVSAAGINTQTVPSALLQSFNNYTKKIKENLHTIDYSNIVYVAGKDDETICDYKIENGKLKFYATALGDQSVTWASGIPQNINRETNLYYTLASHGSLAKKSFLFKGIKEILETGQTQSQDFRRQPPAISESRSMFESKEVFEFEAGESSIENNILGLGQIAIADETNSPILNVRVSKGDLMFATYPLLIGHFNFDGIYSAERIADKYLDKSLTLRHTLGLYPGPIGTSDFFKDDKGTNSFPGCIIVGLGQSEKINSYQLALTVEKAVSGYLLTQCKYEVQTNKSRKHKIGLSSLLIGAGYAGMPVEASCRAILQGIVNANEKVIQLTQLQDLCIDEIEFVELFEDKSISCYSSISALIDGNSDGMNIGWAEKTIRELQGGRKRLIADTANEWWQRLSVIASDADADDKTSEKKLSFYSSTNSSREEKKELKDNIRLIENLFEDISAKKQWSYEKAKTIFELLIPADFKENIKRNSPILWVLDKYTASFPWELLQTGNINEKPLCVTTGMIRQLATGDYKPNISVLKNNNVLIIGDPDLKNFTKARQLSGAAKEAREVYETLNKYNDLQLDDPIINGSSDDILVSMFKKDYRIMHIAAHGFFDDKNPGAAGILIGKQKDADEPLFLTPQQIGQLPHPPELVFLNCCFLGKVSAAAEEYAASRNKFAANIGTELIECGVKAVIVAGWEVDDAAGLEFAKKFYERLASGETFGNAVLEARKHIFKTFKYTNTWGAYQCYGLPHFKLDVKKKEDLHRTYEIEQIAENDLDLIISKSEVAFYNDEELLTELQLISQGINNAGFSSAELRQKEAVAYLELNDYETAIQLYNQLFKNENAAFKVRSLESFQEIRIKSTLAKVLSLEIPLTDDIINKALTEIQEGIDNLKDLMNIWETAERHSSIGSGIKRKARITQSLKTKKADLQVAAEHYSKAYTIEQNTYSYTNWLTITILLQENVSASGKKTNSRKKQTVDLKSIKNTLKELEKRVLKENDNSFWGMCRLSDLALSNYFINPSTGNLEKLKNQMQLVWTRTGSKYKKIRQLENLDLLCHFANETGKKHIAAELGGLVKELKIKL
ncbi:MAG: CHAT domain-containing protein [Niabella sp.]